MYARNETVYIVDNTGSVSFKIIALLESSHPVTSKKLGLLALHLAGLNEFHFFRLMNTLIIVISRQDLRGASALRFRNTLQS